MSKRPKAFLRLCYWRIPTMRRMRDEEANKKTYIAKDLSNHGVVVSREFNGEDDSDTVGAVLLDEHALLLGSQRNVHHAIDDLALARSFHALQQDRREEVALEISKEVRQQSGHTFRVAVFWAKALRSASDIWRVAG